MEDPFCPNYKNCQLVNGKIEVSQHELERYKTLFCTGTNSEWHLCKRFIVKNEIGFCPDFVLPDTASSVDEIIDKFDFISFN
jgi:hypothetical protein